MIIQTVGELRKYLDQFPDDMALVRLTQGHYQVHKQDIDFSKVSTITAMGGANDGFVPKEIDQKAIVIGA